MSAGLHDPSQAVHQRFHWPSRRRGLPVIDRGALTVASGLVGPLAVAGVLASFRAAISATDVALCLVLLVVAVAAGTGSAGTSRRYPPRPGSTSSSPGPTRPSTSPAERRDHGPAARHRRRGDRDRCLGTPPAPRVEQAGRVHRGNPRGGAGGRDGRLRGDADRQVCSSLTAVLSLRACVFQAGMAGIGAPARLEQDGRVTMTHQAWDADRDGLPFSIGTECSPRRTGSSWAGS